MQNITQDPSLRSPRRSLWARDALYLIAYLLLSPWLAYRWLRRWPSASTPFLRMQQRVLGLSSQQLPLELDSNQPIIWMHGVSVGEVQLLMALQQRIAAELPGVQFVLSATTPSGMELAQKRADAINCFYFPCDFSWAVQRTLTTVRPQLLILGELEIWPNLVDICRQENVPMLVVNGRLSDNSFRGYQRFARWTAPIFGKLSHVAAQTPTYAERFQQCGCHPARVSVSGNLKFDNVSFDRSNPRVNELRRLTGLGPQQRTLVLGSSQEPEEIATAAAFLQLRQEFPELRLIVVPRHPDRFHSAFHQ
ncbi:MAG: 3-deoxy-D-manno-octulosonic acid transferase, partial [bacterium]|nr:3-deoxy-D-manno-octulosonic acid transferase [bacterium]